MADVVIVNEQGERIGTKEFTIAIADGSIRAISRVFVVDEENNILLQKRSQHVIMPGLELESAGGHVDPGEAYEEAARKELKEELGLETPVVLVAESVHTENVMSHVYKTTVPVGTDIPYDPEEVASVRWISPAALDTELLERPDGFVTGFATIWQRYQDQIINA